MDRRKKLYTSLRNVFGTNLFEFAVRTLIVLLPFTTILSVFTSQKLGIPGFTYYKELLLILGLGYVAWSHFHGKLWITWGWIDMIILAYIVYLVLISFGTTGIRGIIYGGRYDFEFLMAFWIAYHGSPLLAKPISHYLKIFLISCGIMLFVSGLLKYPLSEDLLLNFGYSGNPSAWQFGSAPPIFQGIDGANVRRFQGILDGPNTMGAFLIMFSGIFIYYIRTKKNWFFVNGIILIGLFIMITYTGSRSATLGFLFGCLLICIMSVRYIYKRYRTQTISMLIIFALLLGGLFVMYSGKMNAIIGRAGSTEGHLDRVITNLHRFEEHPLGQGLGSSGPSYRYVQNLEGLKREEIEAKDAFYIPESWYIQQFVEGGIIGGVLFLMIMLIFFIKLTREHVLLGGMFLGIAVMNLFLHTFESAPFALLFFLLIGIILSEKSHGKHIYEH